MIYEISIRRWDRREGSSSWSVSKINAANVTSAIGKASRLFVRTLDRKARRDMARLLEIRAVKLVEEGAE